MARLGLVRVLVSDGRERPGQLAAAAVPRLAAVPADGRRRVRRRPAHALSGLLGRQLRELVEHQQLRDDIRAALRGGQLEPRRLARVARRLGLGRVPFGGHVGLREPERRLLREPHVRAASLELRRRPLRRLPRTECALSLYSTLLYRSLPIYRSQVLTGAVALAGTFSLSLSLSGCVLAGVCVTLTSLAVSARYCAPAAANLLALPRTPVAAAAQLAVSAQCVTNASPTASGGTLPSALCDGSAGGVWRGGASAALTAGHCACNAGYAPSSDLITCYRTHTSLAFAYSFTVLFIRLFSQSDAVLSQREPFYVVVIRLHTRD